MAVHDYTNIGKLNLDTGAKSSYQVRVSDQTEDGDWDAFLQETAGGHHVQSSSWAQVKASVGWWAARIVVTQEEQIVAGAQVLIRSLPLYGAVGYVTKGPLLTLNDPVLSDLVVNEIHRLARAHRIQYLILQPPDNGEVFAQQLSHWGFRPSSVKAFPIATVRIDLTPELDAIMAKMKSKTRYNIRLGLRKGITVREGTERDIPAFYGMLMSTGERQNFSSNSEEYFSWMWRVLNHHGYMKLFMAEYQGEVVSAMVAIPFGDTVFYKRGAWSGRHGKYRPNEVMHWVALQWAKSQGYRYYDFDGIDPDAAQALLQGDPLPNSATETVTRFKVGFGGQAMLVPRTYDYIYNPLLRWIYRSVFPKISRWPLIKKILSRVQTR